MSTSDATLLPPLKASPHPSEHTRLLLALSATAIVFGGAGVLLVRGAGWMSLAALVLVLLAFAGLVWVGLQIYRARLLGNCIRVTRESAPELCAALEDVRTRLDYHRRVDVCIVDKANPPAQLTSYLGTKVIVFEGSLVADLLRGEDRSQLTFLIARYIGALKERHQRFTLVFVLLEAVSALKFLFPFIYPYYRATTYSGSARAAVLRRPGCGTLGHGATPGRQGVRAGAASTRRDRAGGARARPRPAAPRATRATRAPPHEPLPQPAVLRPPLTARIVGRVLSVRGSGHQPRDSAGSGSARRIGARHRGPGGSPPRPRSPSSPA